jgi:hypothetical protein
MLDTIREYAAAQEAKKAAEAAARAADGVLKGRRQEILDAMGGASAAVCEHVVLTYTEVKAADATFTMVSGEKTPWALVSGLTVGNKYIAADQVASIYGGRAGYPNLSTKGA